MWLSLVFTCLNYFLDQEIGRGAEGDGCLATSHIPIDLTWKEREERGRALGLFPMQRVLPQRGLLMPLSIGSQNSGALPDLGTSLLKGVTWSHLPWAALYSPAWASPAAPGSLGVCFSPVPLTFFPGVAASLLVSPTRRLSSHRELMSSPKIWRPFSMRNWVRLNCES